MSTLASDPVGARPGAGLARADVLRLGRSASPWQFVPLGLQALRIAPHDDEVRFLLACAYARLGLRSCAMVELDAMSAQWRASQPVVQVREQVSRFGDDRVSTQSLASTLAANIERFSSELARALACDADDLRMRGSAWGETFATHAAHRTLTGDVVVQRERDWVLWQDASDAVRDIEKGLSQTANPLAGYGVVVDGMHVPRLIRAVAPHAGTSAEGITTRWTFLCRDADELFWGLALNDLASMLTSQPAEWIVGDDAPQRWAALLHERLDAALPKIVTLPGAGPASSNASQGRRWETLTPSQVLTQHLANQRSASERAMAEMDRLYASRTRAWYASRFASADTGGDPLRVLIVTSRFSTFIRHSAHDLARAFASIGCNARVHMEPDTATRLTSMSYTRAVVEHTPDLLVVINSPRANMGKFVPRNVPYVCWVQDSMPHLFDRSVGESQTALDLVVGQYLPEMYRDFGYDLTSFSPSPVVASEEKFHPGPVSRELRERLACDMAIISHHSATPSELRDTLRAKASASPDNVMTPIIDALFEPLMRLGGRSLDEGPVSPDVPALCERIVRRVLGEEPSAELLAKVQYGVAYPLVDRAIRHQVIAWMVEIAQRRGWSLHLYGRGWDKHPQWRSWARPELAHDEELRAAYQCAGVTVHATVHGCVHQRVLECALSGGLPIFYTKHDDMIAMRRSIMARATADGLLPSVCGVRITEHESFRFDPFCVSADHPELMLLESIWTRRGMGACHWTWAADVARASEHERRVLVPTREYAWLMGDVNHTGFINASELEARVAAAKDRPAWRDNLSRGIRERVSRGLTTRVLARRMLERCAQACARPETTRAA